MLAASVVVLERPWMIPPPFLLAALLLAGVLLKMGSYGMVRIGVSMLPEGAVVVAPFLGALGVVGIVYAALVCLGQRNLKRLIAFSSIGHMGFVLLGIATLTPVGINAESESEWRLLAIEHAISELKRQTIERPLLPVIQSRHAGNVVIGNT